MTQFSALKLTAALLIVLGVVLVCNSPFHATAQSNSPDSTVRLAVASFDPLTQSAVSFLPDTLQQQSRKSAARYYIVQFNGPITAEQKAHLVRMGVELFDYIPDFSFIVRMDNNTVAAVEQLPFIRWTGIYLPDYRISPALMSTRDLNESAGLNESDDEPILTVEALVFPGEETRAIATELSAIGASIVEIDLNEWRDKLILKFPADLLTQIALIEGISWLELAPTWELHNDQARVDGAMDVNDVWAQGFWGEGQTVAIADTQLDTGNTTTMVDDFRECVGTTSRVTISQFGTATSDTHGHGTHVAGSVLGNGRLSGSNCNNYVTFTAGVAPHAAGYFQSIMNTDGSLGGIPANLNNLFQPAYTFGARIHTNSWGSSVMGQYTIRSQEADQFAWNNPDFLILYSAGNDGRDSDANGVIDVHSLGAPATAKNILTVGASENNRPGILTWNAWYTPVAPIFGTDRANNYNGLAAFSSRGPTDDGRIKPDIVAPGTFINSVRSTASAGSGNYVLYSGTSMATPLTAGAAALARQAFQTRETYAPSSAMLKSLLTNGATDLYPGQYGGGATQEIPITRPTVHAGWGRVDLENALFPAVGRTWWWDDNDTTVDSSLNDLSTGSTVTYTFALNSTAPLHVTLAWTDYPGTPIALGGLVNDLDMRLEGPGGPYYSNNAAQRLSSEPLDYNNGGSFTHLLTPANGQRVAMRFTPTQYPAIPATAKLWFYNNLGGSAGSVAFNLVVYADNGGGAPGTALCSLPRRASWSAPTGFYPVIIDLSSCSLSALAAGDFYVAIEFTSARTGTGQLLLDNSPTLRGWSNNGGGWVNNVLYDYGITVIAYRPVMPVTAYDRVNNLIGMDLAAPATGVYDLVVTGYNVPQGPQPYALTLSGDFQMMGAETITRTIVGPGVYKFGNTGVSINFTGEDIDTVAVTVNRDRFPTTGMNSVKRAYNITAQGGSGVFTADVILSYEQAEFAASGIGAETALQAFRYDGSAWTPQGGTVNTTENTVTVNGVTAFSGWALGEVAPTAVTLTNASGGGVFRMPSWLSVLAVVVFGGLTLGVVWASSRRRAS